MKSKFNKPDTVYPHGLSVEELLKPRVKIIASWPGMEEDDYEVGQIHQGKDELDLNVRLIEKHPHLFKRLEWWEDRKLEEMPQYVKRSGNVFEFKKLLVHEDYPRKTIATFIVKGKYDNITSNGTYPATEQEYLDYQKQQNEKSNISKT